MISDYWWTGSSDSFGGLLSAGNAEDAIEEAQFEAKRAKTELVSVYHRVKDENGEVFSEIYPTK